MLHNVLNGYVLSNPSPNTFPFLLAVNGHSRLTNLIVLQIYSTRLLVPEASTKREETTLTALARRGAERELFLRGFGKHCLQIINNFFYLLIIVHIYFFIIVIKKMWYSL